MKNLHYFVTGLIGIALVVLFSIQSGEMELREQQIRSAVDSLELSFQDGLTHERYCSRSLQPCGGRYVSSSDLHWLCGHLHYIGFFQRACLEFAYNDDFTKQ